MYYLFIHNEKDLREYKEKFVRVKDCIERGKTPVFNEMAGAKTNLCESLPYNLILAFFTVIGAIVTERIQINEILKIAILLIINNFFGAVSNYIFTVIKHKLRLRLCRRLEIEPTERNIAVMESMEYQSV